MIYQRGRGGNVSTDRLEKALLVAKILAWSSVSILILFIILEGREILIEIASVNKQGE